MLEAVLFILAPSVTFIENHCVCRGNLGNIKISDKSTIFLNELPQKTFGLPTTSCDSFPNLDLMGLVQQNYTKEDWCETYQARCQ